MSFVDSLLGVDPFFAEFDRISQRLLEGTDGARYAAPVAMPMDVVRRGDTLLVSLDLPGVDPESVGITANGRTLTIEASRETGDQEGDVVFLRGRAYGKVSRQLSLPEGLDLDLVSASYENGVLTMQLPVAESAKPRRISIAHSGAAKEIAHG
jgi:HSP20 family protein